MSDLETRVRHMLHERALDVTTVPAHLERLDLPDERDRPRHARQWLVAASVVAVLAIAGGAIVLGRSGAHRSAPAVSTSPSPTPHPTTPPSPVTRADAVARTAQPTRLRVSAPTGYGYVFWSSRPAYRQVGLRPGNENEIPAGSNGGTSATAFVTVWDAGRFDGFDPSWRTTTFAGRRAYLGKAMLAGGSHKISSLIYTSAAGRTVLVQGDTTRTSSESALRTLAAGVTPDSSTPTDVPFRLTAVPSGLALTYVEDELSIGYSLDIRLEGKGLTVEILVWHKRDFSGFGLTPGAPTRTIAGRPGVLDTEQAQAAVQVSATTALLISASRTRNGDPVPAVDVLQQVVGGLRLTGSTLERAIP